MDIKMEDFKGYEHKAVIASEANAIKNISKRIDVVISPLEATMKYNVLNQGVVVKRTEVFEEAIYFFNSI